jgi:drug/metabolite transporter (DMT)-like permease
MRPRDGVELLILAALWGASFLFMRVAAPAFGPFALVFVRVAGAGAVLLPLLLWQGQGAELRRHWKPIALVGLTNSALPFLCFTFAALALSAGLMSIFNATTPLWTALIGWGWLRDRVERRRWLGMALGFAGVLWLAADRAGLKAGAQGASPALAAGVCLLAPALYGLSANATKRHLTGVPPLVLAAGSQLSAALLLALPAAWAWPAAAPDANAWLAALALALAGTAGAYLLYFRLIAHAGPASASTVTFLIPVFALSWGALFLAERPTPAMLVGCAAVLAGSALATGWLRRPRTH